MCVLGVRTYLNRINTYGLLSVSRHRQHAKRIPSNSNLPIMTLYRGYPSYPNSKLHWTYVMRQPSLSGICQLWKEKATNNYKTRSS